VSSLQRVQQTLKKNGLHLDETVAVVGSLMQTPEFQQILAVHNKVQDVWCFNAPPTPASAHGHQLVQEVKTIQLIPLSLSSFLKLIIHQTVLAIQRMRI